MAGEPPPNGREGFLTALLGAAAEAPLCVYDRDLRMIELFWGGEERRYGYSVSEILGKRFSEVMSAEDAAPVEEAVRAVFETGEPRRLARHFDLPVGRTAFEVRFDPIRGPTGEVEHVLTISHDVTERWLAQEALRESERHYTSLAATLPVGVWRTDPATRMVYSNRRLWEFLDLEPESLGELDLATIAAHVARERRLDPEEAQRLWPHAERAIREQGPAEFEMRWRVSDGSPRWFLVRALPERDADGRFIGHVGAISDITERKQAEEALRESEHRFHSLAEAMPIGVWRTDRDRTVIYANRRALELLDLDPDGANPEDLREMLAQMAESGRIEMKDSERLWDESELAVQRETINPSFIRLRQGDGGERHLQTLAVPEFDSAGSFVGHVGVTVDVTELTRAQQELARHRDDLEGLVAERTIELERSYEALRRSERLAAVGTFAAGIAHQINNPVGAILLAGQFALEALGDRERVEHALRDITADALHCARIVRGVLEFAQGPTDAPQPCDLNQIARDGAHKLQADAAERGAELRLDLDAGLPPVAGSEAALEQVLANLVYNAIEAGAGEIVIATRQAPGGIALVVRDDGQGISDENLDRIFDPLFTTRASLGGTGLGLALARGIVEALGGTIEVKSRESEGTEVVVRLRRVKAAARARKPSPPPGSKSKGRPSS